MISSACRINNPYNVLSRFIHSIRVYLRIRLYCVVEQTSLYKAYYLLSLHNIAVLIYTDRFFLLTNQEKLHFKLVQYFDYNIVICQWSSKRFFTKMISEKSSIKCLIWTKTFLNTQHFFDSLPMNLSTKNFLFESCVSWTNWLQRMLQNNEDYLR